MKSNWAQSVTIDLFECPHEMVDNKESIHEFIRKTAKLVHPKSEGPIYSDRFEDKSLHLSGYSAMTLHESFSITAHLDDVDNRAYIDVFSCQNFSIPDVVEFSKSYFQAKKVIFNELER